MAATQQEQQPASPSPIDLSPTVEAVAKGFGERPVTAREIVAAILARHESDYIPGKHQQLATAWPPISPSRPISRWLAQIRTFFRPEAAGELFGRAVILGVGLVDPSSGRAMEASGLFHQLSLELRPALGQALTGEGHEAIASLPLAAAFAGVAKPRVVYVAEPATAVPLSGDSRFAAGRISDGTIAVWDVKRSAKTWTEANTIAQGPHGLWLNRDGSELAIASGESVELRRSGSPPLTLPVVPVTNVALGDVANQRAPAVSWCSFSDAGDSIAVAYASGLIKLFSLAGGDASETASLAQTARVSHMVLRGGRLLCASGDTARLWDVVAHSELATFQHPSSQVISVALDTSGALVASGDENGTLRLWDPRTLTVRSSVVHGEPVRCLALSADGRFLASGGEDGFVKLWRVDGLVEIGRLPHLGTQVWDLAFDATGTELESTANDGMGRRWELFAEAPLAPSYLPDQVPDEQAPDWIDDDVDAFARLIASRHMSPPVSIAVFGDWGSGKTYFMRRLQQRVGRLARQARDSGLQQRDIGYYKRVAQVEFNAWHYAGADLWASLVDNLFSQLWIEGDEKEATHKRLEALFEDSRQQDDAAFKVATMEVQLLEDERAAAEKRASAVEDRATALQDKLAGLRAAEERAAYKFVDELSDDARQALKSAGYPEDLGSVPAQVVEAVRKANQTAREAKALSALVRAPDRGLRLMLLLAALIVPLVTGLLVIVVLPLSTVRDFLGLMLGIGGAAASATVWLQKQFDWLVRLRAVLAGTDRKAEAELKATADELESARAATKRQLEAVKAELAEARDREKLAAVRKQDRENEIRSGKPATLLARLIGDRAESDYYRKHLGLLSLVRRDFEAISDFVDADRISLDNPELTAAEEAAGDDRRINRIVLYIDDLDRCPPDVVVRVLEAIHLLLSFPLFVVVVGVDSRWVSRALALKYPDLLPERRRRTTAAASPLDYLEKIFQIPYWVEPLEPVRTRQLIEQLLGRRLTEADRQEQAANVPTGPQGSNGQSQDRQAAASGTPVQAAQAARPAEDLSPKTMELTRPELAAIDDLAPLLVRTPRALKRFLNIYRLLRTKAFYDGFTEDRGALSDFRVVMFLLAIVTSQPEGASAFFSELLAHPDPGHSLLDAATSAAAASVDIEPVRDWLKDPARLGLASAHSKQVDGWAREVVRYSFRAPRPRD